MGPLTTVMLWIAAVAFGAWIVERFVRRRQRRTHVTIDIAALVAPPTEGPNAEAFWKRLADFARDFERTGAMIQASELLAALAHDHTEMRLWGADTLRNSAHLLAVRRELLGSAVLGLNAVERLEHESARDTHRAVAMLLRDIGAIELLPEVLRRARDTERSATSRANMVAAYAAMTRPDDPDRFGPLLEFGRDADAFVRFVAIATLPPLPGQATVRDETRLAYTALLRERILDADADTRLHAAARFPAHLSADDVRVLLSCTVDPHLGVAQNARAASCGSSTRSRASKNSITKY